MYVFPHRVPLVSKSATVPLVEGVAAFGGAVRTALDLGEAVALDLYPLRERVVDPGVDPEVFEVRVSGVELNGTASKTRRVTSVLGRLRATETR